MVRLRDSDLGKKKRRRFFPNYRMLSTISAEGHETDYYTLGSLM